MDTTTMRAAVRDRFGPPETLRIASVPKPVPAAGEVLVRVRASSLNRADWYTLIGRPLAGRLSFGLLRPRSPRVGVDYAGVVEAVGPGVTKFKAGDEVFGGRDGAFADYVTVHQDRGITAKPAGVSFDDAATVGIAGITALQAVRDMAKVQAGQRVLVNGASGAVGTFAVQIAKAFGAEVTAVASPHNVEQARSLGADHVIDYTQADFTRGETRYDAIVDVAGSRPWSQVRRVLEPHGRLVIVGAPGGTGVLGPLGHIAATKLAALRSPQQVVFFVAQITQADLGVLADMLADGRVRPAIEQRRPFGDIAAALRYVGEGHARAKTVITM